MLLLDIHVVENTPSNHTHRCWDTMCEDSGDAQSSVARTKAQRRRCAWKHMDISLGNKSSCCSWGELIKVINCFFENGLCSVEHSVEVKAFSYQNPTQKFKLLSCTCSLCAYVCTCVYIYMHIPMHKSYVIFIESTVCKLLLGSVIGQ